LKLDLILNIETSTSNCSVSLSNGEDLIDIIEIDNNSYSHSENLHSFIQKILKKNKFKSHELACISVSRGPGSYTGLRIGVSAAKGLCFANDIPLISVSSLEILANSTSFKGIVIPTIDARRDEVYSCVFFENHIITEEKPEIITQVSFKGHLKNNEILIIGSGQFKCEKIIKKNKNLTFNNEIINPSSRHMPILSYRKFINKDFEDLAYFEPRYLKEFKSR
jgi:tRNA threonylcarbamoyladenosine biosynthesis protein TsaB